MLTHSRKEKILVVDDTPANVKLLVHAMIDQYDLLVANDGETALHLATQEAPDLILLDIMMPGMDGCEVCRQLKASEQTREIPVIFLTARSGVEDEIKGFELGAVDYITKPISIATLRARVKTHLALQAAFRQIQQQNTELRYERAVVESVVARMSQSAMFDGSCLRVLRSAVDKISGDLLLSAIGPSQHQHVLVGDFAGHGLTAAIGGPIVSEVFYSKTLNGDSLEQIVTEINRVLCEKLPDHMFMVGCFLDVNPTRQQITIWNCAMPDVVIFRHGLLDMKVASAFLARGMLDRSEKTGTVIHVNKGDVVFVYTDGVVDETDQNGTVFGNDRLDEVFREIVASGKPLSDLFDILKHYRSGRIQRDDMMVVELTC